MRDEAKHEKEKQKHIIQSLLDLITDLGHSSKNNNKTNH